MQEVVGAEPMFGYLPVGEALELGFEGEQFEGNPFLNSKTNRWKVFSVTMRRRWVIGMLE